MQKSPIREVPQVFTNPLSRVHWRSPPILRSRYLVLSPRSASSSFRFRLFEIVFVDWNTSGRVLVLPVWNLMEKHLNFYGRFHPTKCSHGLHIPNDRISSLPVDILSIILSSLSLKEMVRTNILSKRWLNLWTNTPVLDFHRRSVFSHEKNDDNIIKLVNHILRQHKGLYLKEFKICCMIWNKYQEDIDGWLEFALARKVEILELDFSCVGYSFSQEHNYVFPGHWFTSWKDDIGGSKSRVLLYNLKYLKSLSLKSVNVTGEDINAILRNCPFLARLAVVGSNRLVNLVISDPTLELKYLQIRYCFALKVMTISNFNLVSLNTTVGDIILQDLPMLVELSILGFSNNLRGILSRNATCLINLKSLKLHARKLKEVTELPSNLAQMTKLKRLVIGCTAEYDESLTALLYIIKSCNHLEEFVLEMGWYELHRMSRTMQKVERLGFDSLKVFVFNGYHGRVSDVELLMHVAMNSPRLEKIIIDTYNANMREINYHDHGKEQEARRFALKHIEDLRESKHILPHVDVDVTICKCV